MNEALLEKIHDSIQNSGFVSELKVSRIFEKNRWFLSNNTVYMDGDKQKEIDVYGIFWDIENEGLKEVDLRFHAIGEVKKTTEKPWIFFESNLQPDSFFDYDSDACLSFENITSSMRTDFFKYYPSSDLSFKSTSYVETFKKDENATANSNIYKAIDSVIKACRYYKFQSHLSQNYKIGDLNRREHVFDRNKVSFLSIFMPVVIFDGILVSARLTNKDKIEVKEVNCVAYKGYHIEQSGQDRLYNVDIVKLDYLDQYLNKVQRWYSRKCHEIKKLRHKL